MSRPGFVDVFHFSDGWIERFPVDARELVGLRQGSLAPTEQEFLAAKAGGAKAGLNWPAGVVPPPWYAQAVAPPPADPAPSGAPTAP